MDYIFKMLQNREEHVSNPCIGKRQTHWGDAVWVGSAVYRAEVRCGWKKLSADGKGGQSKKRTRNGQRRPLGVGQELL